MMEFMELYDNKYVRSLIQLVPFGSAADVLIKETIDEINKDRLRVFFNKLEVGNIQLTEEIIKNEDFLHNYFATIRIVINTRRREKIELFGNLFNRAVVQNFINSFDKYNFYLTILDDLTLKEINILHKLYRLECKTQPKDKSRNERLIANKGIWEEFKQNMQEDMNIIKNCLEEELIRIERTGCLYIPRVTINDFRSYSAVTTEIYSKLKDLIVS
ncbi:MAG: hypothetical protein HQ541_14620 [Mariniphaga sp.]|nr:hypothetical protein [Mariniphaga sp.]